MSFITWETFKKDAKELINISNEINDSWTLQGDLDNTEIAYLKKTQSKLRKFKPCDLIKKSDVSYFSSNAVQSVLKWEYNVFYSSSYNVPVLCFNVWKDNGSLLRLEEVWDQCQLAGQSSKDLYSAITQQEHPILLRPYFTIHPCKTSDILETSSVKNYHCNYIIKYLSAIGPTVNLLLDIKYGLPKS